MEQQAYKKAYFFCHKECEYFPCHKTEHPEDFNCLFCYCPLYALGEKCGGNYSYTENGVKSCINCLIPHHQNGYFCIVSKLPEVIAMSKKDGAQTELAAQKLTGGII